MQILYKVCSDVFTSGMPAKLANIIQMVVLTIQVAVPILLIIWGMLDLGKAVVAQKEDEIKKGQQTFVKRIIAAAIVFFVFTITDLLIGLVADSTDKSTITTCINDILNCDKV